jgi:hypothetical protein
MPPLEDESKLNKVHPDNLDLELYNAQKQPIELESPSPYPTEAGSPVKLLKPMESELSYIKSLEIEPCNEYNHNRCYMFAFLTSLGLGYGNYLVADLSVKLGIRWVYPTCISNLVVYFIYHIFNSMKDSVPLFSKKTSQYYKAVDKKYVLRSDSIWILIRKTVITIVLFTLISMCFTYAFESGINVGIISSIFATSLIFTSVIFYI